MFWELHLRRVAAALACVAFAAVAQPSNAQPREDAITTDPTLLTAPKPTGAVTADRLRQVLQQLRNLPDPFRRLIPTEDQAHQLVRSVSNDWTISTSISIFQHQIPINATVSVAPGANNQGGGGQWGWQQPQNQGSQNQGDQGQSSQTTPVLLRFEGTLGSADFGNGVGFKGGTLVFAVAADSDSQGGGYSGGPQKLRMATEFKPSVSFNNVEMAAAIDLSPNAQQDSVQVTSDATLGQLFSILANVPKLKDIVFDSLTLSHTGISGEFRVGDQKMLLTRDSFSSPPAYQVTTQGGDGILVSDVVPGADLIPLLTTTRITNFRLADQQMHLQGNFSNRQFTIDAAPGSFNLTATLSLSQLLPKLAGIPFADQATFNSLSITGDKAVINGSYYNKSISVTRTRGNDTTLDITAAGLSMGDVIHNAQILNLDQFVQLNEIVVADDHIAVDLKINEKDAEVYVLRGTQPTNRFAFIYFEELDPATFIPNSNNTGLSGVGLRKTLFAFGESNRTFGQSDLPGDLGSKVTLPSGASLNVTPASVALSGSFDVGSSKTLTDILAAVSISQTSFPIIGSFSGETIRNLPAGTARSVNSLNNADKSRLLSMLNLSVPMTVPKVPGLDAYVAPGGPFTLSVKGNNNNAAPRAQLSGSFPVKLTIDGSEMDLLAVSDLDKGLNGQGSSGDIKIELDKPWNQPFGVPGIVVNSGSFAIDFTNKTAADLTMTGSATFASRNNVNVTASFARDASTNALAFQYFEFDASQGFPLSGLPGFGNVPHADQFTVDTLKLSRGGIEAKTMLNKVHVDAFIFKDANGGAVFAVDQQGLKLVDMFPALSTTPLSDFTLGNAAIVVSESGVTGDPKTAPAVARDLFADIFGNSSVALNLPQGVALLSRIDFSKSGTIATALTKIGVHADSAVVMGAVSGLFGGASPSFNLSIMMDQLGDASGLPKNVMNYKAGTQPGFFINWSGDEVDIGVRTAMMVKAGKDMLEFDASVEVVFSETGLGVEVIGGMDGTWNQPFGLQPLTLSNVKLETGIDATGNVSLGFTGAQTFGKESMSVATKAKFALEAEGLPDAVAFAGTADVVGPDMLLEIAQAAAGGKLDLSAVKLPFFNIKKFNLSIATPGAADPQLGIKEGVSFGGIFSFMEQDLGSVQGVASTSGLTFDGKLTNFSWGPIDLQNNTIDVAISAQPKVDLHSNVRVLFAHQDVTVDLTPPNADLTVLEDLGDFGKAQLKVDITGLNLTTGKFDKNADISVTGTMQADLVPRLKQVIKEGAAALRKAADGKLNDDMQALKDAQAKVNDLNNQIAAAKQAAQQRQQAADARIQAAENRVNSLNSELSKDQHEADSCGNRVTHHFCKPYWLVRKAATQAAIAVADGVLEAAKAAVNVATDLDPTVLGLEAQRDTERLGLSIAMAVVKGSEEVVDAVTGPFQRELDKVLDSLPFTIQQAFFAFDLQQMIRSDAPMLLDLQYTLLQEQRRDYLAFKLKDWEFNAKSFAVLPSLVAEKAVANIAGQISPKVADWLNSHIGTELAAAYDDIRDQVLQAEAQFQKTLQGMEDHTGRYQSAVDNLTNQRTQTASELGTTDFLGPSQQFNMTYIAVGHSALCLAVASDGKTVHQENCKNTGTEQWRTNPVDDYVQIITNGLCLQAQDDAASADKQGVQLMLKTCDANDRSEHWKIATYDNVYSQIVNRASQKCLHFDSENARPETAKAVWTSCLGMDSQLFRPIPDAEKPTYMTKNARLASAQNTCMLFQPNPVNAQQYGTYRTGSCDASALQDPFARASNVQEALFDFVELVDGGIRLVHLLPGKAPPPPSKAQDGFCVYQGGGGNPFDQPCNRATGMIFDVLEVQQSFMLRNRDTNLCLDITNVSTGANSVSIGPFMHNCDQTQPTQLLRWIAPLAKS